MKMSEQTISEIDYNKGYEKGYSDAMQCLSEKFEKILLKSKTESYDEGYQAGANQKDNDPCLCGFWGNKK
mgnify:CR=1 FL=1|tara:strand:- start:1327 stop:1536 length:210 start_codon:yes stop_codon:yes gene_type:complete